ncbi:MAG TPA: sugar transferase [Gemmatimonadales bacterium]|jgi:hypothetical protein|nr:sugar transferase [Gemmatimonadales bacterium]
MGRVWRRIRIGILASDAVAVLAGYALATIAHQQLLARQLGGRVWPVYTILATSIALITVALGWGQGLYRRWALLGTYPVYPRLIGTATHGVVGVVMLSYFLGGPPFVSRSWLVMAWLGSMAGLVGSRLVWRRFIQRHLGRGEWLRRVLIAGANQHGIAVARQLRDPRHGTEVVGFLDDYQRPGTEVADGLAVVDHPLRAAPVADRLDVEQIIIIGGALSWESQRHLAELVTRPDQRVEAWVSPTFYDLLTTSTEMTHVGHVPLLYLYPTRLRGWGAGAKGLIDAGVALLLAVALAPAWIYWWLKARWLGVPMVDRERVMSASGAFELMALHSGLVRSPAVARLPALFNVLRREMSLVGPRPIEPRELRSHDRWWSSLATMRPGLTGLWRLYTGNLTVEERVALDVYYVRNYSLALDAQILYLTVRGLAGRMLGTVGVLARWHPEHPAAPAEGEAVMPVSLRRLSPSLGIQSPVAGRYAGSDR